MSAARHRLTLEQEPFLTVRSLPAVFSGGHTVETHSHPWHQLLYACTGAMTVHAARFSWMIPPGRAVFIPAGCSHSLGMWGDVRMRSLYLAPELVRANCHVVAVTPLFREIILRIIDTRALDSRVPAHNRLLSVLLDEMDLKPETPLELPMPSDARALGAAREILSGRAGDRTLDSVARQAGASRRTLERLFQAQTGMSLGLWRQKACLLHSIRLLAEGSSVTEAALNSGYNSLSAFISAFRRTFGYTPGSLIR